MAVHNRTRWLGQATVSARVLGSVAAAVASICLIPHKCVDVSSQDMMGVVDDFTAPGSLSADFRFLGVAWRT